MREIDGASNLAIDEISPRCYLSCSRGLVDGGSTMVGVHYGGTNFLIMTEFAYCTKGYDFCHESLYWEEGE